MAINAIAVIMPGGIVAYRVPSRHRRVPGRRGRVRGFSAHSRRRLMRRLMRVDWSVARDQSYARARVLFVTLTYPSDYPTDFRVYKAHLHAFFERLRRAYPGFGAVWKLEYQRRGAPHYHIVLFLPRPINLGYFRLWVATAWYHIVGSYDERHLRAGTGVELVRPGRGLMAYLSKYLAKEYVATEYTGRVWGFVGRVPFGRVVLYPVRWVEFLRRVRRWGKRRRFFRRAANIWGIVLYGDGAALFDLCRGIRVDIALDKSLLLRYNGANY